MSPARQRPRPAQARACPECARVLRFDMSFLEGLEVPLVQHDRYTCETCKVQYESIGSGDAHLEPLDYLPDRAVRRKAARRQPTKKWMM